jgi:hypothetical protein
LDDRAPDKALLLPPQGLLPALGTGVLGAAGRSWARWYAIYLLS